MLLREYDDYNDDDDDDDNNEDEECADISDAPQCSSQTLLILILHIISQTSDCSHRLVVIFRVGFSFTKSSLIGRRRYT